MHFTCDGFYEFAYKRRGHGGVDATSRKWSLLKEVRKIIEKRTQILSILHWRNGLDIESGCEEVNSQKQSDWTKNHNIKTLKIRIKL